MSCCSGCDGDFVARDTLTPCFVSGGIFHASKNKNCAGISESELNVIELKKTKSMIFYR